MRLKQGLTIKNKEKGIFRLTFGSYCFACLKIALIILSLDIVKIPLQVSIHKFLKPVMLYQQILTLSYVHFLISTVSKIMPIRNFVNEKHNTFYKLSLVKGTFSYMNVALS
jgi:hypothetical protein